MKISEYNIIPIGDHCAISLILKELNLREKSYPFDWVVNREQLYDTNIIHNIELIHKLESTSVDSIVAEYIGDALDSENKTNSKTHTWFIHDNESKSEVIQKYERRFNRLKEDICKKNVFILLTRCYYIEKYVFEYISNILLINNNSIILFISGTDHTYFQDMQSDTIQFKYIPYDASNAFNEDYSSFRPKIKAYLSDLFLKS
jgi:hypothetical protein